MAELNENVQNHEIEKDYFKKIGAYGQLIVISGPGGVGKRTLVKEYLKLHPIATKCPTVTTREPREGEVEGDVHFFISNKEFDQLVRTKELVDYTYYKRVGYGTTRHVIDAARAQGKNVILIEDAAGAMRVKAAYPDATLITFLTPTWEELEERIRERVGEDNPEELEDRLQRAQEQILCADQFDYVLVNDTVEKSVRRLGQIIHGNRFSKTMMHEFLNGYIQSELTSDVVDEIKA